MASRSLRQCCALSVGHLFFFKSMLDQAKTRRVLKHQGKGLSSVPAYHSLYWPLPFLKLSHFMLSYISGYSLFLFCVISCFDLSTRMSFGASRDV